jgi:hypothetical protein
MEGGGVDLELFRVGDDGEVDEGNQHLGGTGTGTETEPEPEFDTEDEEEGIDSCLSMIALHKRFIRAAADKVDPSFVAAALRILEPQHFAETATADTLYAAMDRMAEVT